MPLSLPGERTSSSPDCLCTQLILLPDFPPTCSAENRSSQIIITILSLPSDPRPWHRQNPATLHQLHTQCHKGNWLSLPCPLCSPSRLSTTYASTMKYCSPLVNLNRPPISQNAVPNLLCGFYTQVRLFKRSNIIKGEKMPCIHQGVSLTA